MRKMQKDSIVELVNLLIKAQEHVKNLLLQREYASVLDLLQQCQQGAIQIGTIIEQSESEGFPTVKLLEEYCELVFQVFEMVQSGLTCDTDILESMNRILSETQDSIRKNIKIRKEMVFLPYKASMWDSLESIWKAAKEDGTYDVYVVPIPYFERDAKGELDVFHYEGDSFPSDVPIVHYDEYPLEEIRPAAIFIHNPYDHGNYVTSVHPRFYSYELKKYTNTLVYVPYYSTSGGLSEGQALCNSYLHVDYLVVQAEKYKNFIDLVIPREKILPFGSPKFDRILRLCENPPQPPKEWMEKINGRKVYFYNTSISGMLADTKSFLLKMEYVFKCFQGREDACILWRPHPLLESTFDSMRKSFRSIYDRLKKFFVQNNLGIYDDTPDVGMAIAISDAYVGDTGSSIVSLFGVSGKEIFVLDNRIHSLPKESDWRGNIIKPFYEDGYDEWRVTQGDKLYYSPSNDYHYEYYCDLNKYTLGGYYHRAFEVDGRIFVCPQNAQDILVIEEHKIVRKISLIKRIERQGSFLMSYKVNGYLLLVPNFYPAIVRYDIMKDKVDYIEGCHDLFSDVVDGKKCHGGSCVWKNYLFLFSPVEDKVLALEVESMEVQLLTTGSGEGCLFASVDDEGIWLLPWEGTKVCYWNPEMGEKKEYTQLPEGFECRHEIYGTECMKRPFCGVASYGKYAVLAPYWGNMFVRIDKQSGNMESWEPEIPVLGEPVSNYYVSEDTSKFVRRIAGSDFLFYSEPWRKLYKINIETGSTTEVEIGFNQRQLLENEAGFSEWSEWLKYGCVENATQTLPGFLDGKLWGKAHDVDMQKKSYAEVIANGDGTAGEKIYQYIKQKM